MTTEFLTEAWKNAYDAYLEEEESKISEDIDVLFEELSHARDESTDALNILQEYYNLYALLETPTGDNNSDGAAEKGHDGKPAGSGGSSSSSSSSNDKRDDKESKSLDIANIFKVLNAGQEAFGADYSPAAVVTKESIRDMKFPRNIIFFIGQLIKWIKNIVLYFIGKIVNLIRRLTGSGSKVGFLNLEFPTLDLAAKKESKLDIGTVRLAPSMKNIELYKLDADKLSMVKPALTESGFFDAVLDPNKKLVFDGQSDKEVGRTTYMVKLDFSKDIENLRTLVQHFYDLFDNAYGSNNEKLFETDDLELILGLIKTQFERIKNGDAITTYALGGSAMEVESVNSDRVKENLILTNSNITSLKEAYMATSKKISDITMVIQGKEMLALSQYGISYKALTETTLRSIKKITDTIPERLKQATKMEKKLIKMKKAYEAVISSLSGMQKSILAVSNVTFTSPYQKQTNDLLNSTKYMSDTITLRLSGIALYIKELQDVYGLMKILANLNKK